MGDLRLRIPSWSKQNRATRCGNDLTVSNCCVNGYLTLSELKAGEVIELKLDDRVRQILPPCADSPDADSLAAYAYGPVVLAADARICDVNATVVPLTDEEGFVAVEHADRPFDEIPDARVRVLLAQKNGGSLRLVDYSSAGKTYNEASRCGVWLALCL